MQAVVLVGGLGTRLRPLTETIPKQLLPVAGVAVIERVLSQLGAHGIERAVLSMGYLPDPFRHAYPSGRIGGVEVEFAVEDTALGTAGAILFAGRSAGIDETFLAVNGDVMTDLDVSALVERHRSTGAEGTIALTPVEDPSRYGVVETDGDGRVTAFVEKPPAGTAASNHVNAGTYVLEPSFLDRVSSSGPVSIETEVFPLMVADGGLFALVDTAYWLDVGTPNAYLRANTDVLDGNRVVPHPGARVGSSIVLAGATISSTASVERSVLAAGVVVGHGATVHGAVLLDGAHIKDGATVTDSVVGPGAVIGSGATLAGNCLVAQGARVPARALLDGVPVGA